MAELRDLFESLGHTEVSTFIQSGNVIFSAAKSVTPKSLETAISKRFHVDTTVVLRTPSELEKVVKANPFARAGADTSKLHVGFMTQKPGAAVVAELDAHRFPPEEFAIRDRDLYLHLPNGMGRSKLPAYLDRQLATPTTVRNWSTVTKLIELAGR
jgi:uncharacterized protein (DUF1697 family)